MNSRLGGMVAGDEEAHGGAFSSVETGEGVGGGTGVKESGCDGYGVGGRLLAVVFRAVGGDVMEQSRSVDGGIEVGSSSGAGLGEVGMRLEERLEFCEVSVDDGVDGLLKGIDGGVAAGDGGDEGGERFPVGEVAAFGDGVSRSGFGLGLVVGQWGGEREEAKRTEWRTGRHPSG